MPISSLLNKPDPTFEVDEFNGPYPVSHTGGPVIPSSPPPPPAAAPLLLTWPFHYSPPLGKDKCSHPTVGRTSNQVSMYRTLRPKPSSSVRSYSFFNPAIGSNALSRPPPPPPGQTRYRPLLPAHLISGHTKEKLLDNQRKGKFDLTVYYVTIGNLVNSNGGPGGKNTIDEWPASPNGCNTVPLRYYGYSKMKDMGAELLLSLHILVYKVLTWGCC
ncbi:hypothetical protein BJ085DRAFT_29786 [Dimargaris cristalligena]|uniref:Uncharacterized protein n=1 Tax=Dimargaris cristalligena TaxID=215637 RepID=A0A4Q0A2F1_9FUNG|nr:hypothetical protein BJ085DRAFT_29786 [Dimargaris cristalligena]|eukprot:RKP40285.1 hypothetical protein BJ085DRAFT_29786 [Dimargaris cristalligena]